jgi:hypothetical protein
MVGARRGVLRVYGVGSRGHPLYLGDSGDGDNKNHGMRLMEVLGGDRSEGGRPQGV